MIKKLLSYFFKQKKQWWQEPGHWTDKNDYTSKYGTPGTPLGDTPIQKPEEMEQSIRILPRWYKGYGYQQPTKQDQF